MSRLFFISILVSHIIVGETLAESYQTLSVEKDEVDPALKEFSYDIGYGTEYFTAYVRPHIQQFSRGEHQHAKTPRMNGHALKVINMSPETIRLYWVPGVNKDPLPMSLITPFGATGTASFPDHVFMLASTDDDHKDKKTPLITFNVKDRIVFYYDPFNVPNDPKLTRSRMAKLSYVDYENYETLKRNRAFAEKYEKFTGREYISRYPRQQPRHKMWRADYFEQEHWVTSKETHFKEIPETAMKKLPVHGKERELGDKPRFFSEYRTGDEYLNMTLKVMSCAPRAFEIENFLSNAEVDHILHLAHITPMSVSSTGSLGDTMAQKAKTDTRTSRNTWIEREKDSVIDSVYRRGADLLRIDEKLLRHSRRGNASSRSNIAEALQLVHYDKKQEYTAHQ